MIRADLVLVGFGNVAQRLVSLLEERADDLRTGESLACRIAGQVTRRGGAFFGRDRCADVFAVLDRLADSDAELKILVETTTLDVMKGEPAITHVRAAIARALHVVTANKGPVAFAYHDLREEAARAGVAFLFEGSVMDGVPIFNLVRETMPVVKVAGFEGVVNTTTNHIITALESGQAFDSALAEMQARGIAEADPALDVDGWDAAAKTAALANVLMDARITPHDVRRTGLDAGTAAAAREALARGRRLKLVASASRRTDGGIEAAVSPRELPSGHLLATLAGDANALILRTDLLNDVAICQLSGSLTQTAYALLSDIVSLSRHYR